MAGRLVRSVTSARPAGAVTTSRPPRTRGASRSAPIRA